MDLYIIYNLTHAKQKDIEGQRQKSIIKFKVIEIFFVW